MNSGILSFAQERLWFIEQYEVGTNSYHIPAVYELNMDTNIMGVKHALQQILSRHEILRTTIEQKDNENLQIVHNDPLSIDEVTLSDSEDYMSVIKKDVNRLFILNEEYPIRAKFYFIRDEIKSNKKKNDKILLLINMHHIVCDGWSMEIFQKELLAYYKAYIENNSNFTLPDLSAQYIDYALWQKSYLSGETLEK